MASASALKMTEVAGVRELSSEGPAARGSLAGRVAILTGSTGGLGFALAEGLAQARCRIMLNGIESPDTVETARGDLEDRTGVAVAYHRANVGDPGDVEELVDATLKRFGAIDILVNNAVVRHFSPIVDFPTENWNAALAVNLSAAFHAIK